MLDFPCPAPSSTAHALLIVPFLAQFSLPCYHSFFLTRSYCPTCSHLNLLALFHTLSHSTPLSKTTIVEAPDHSLAATYLCCAVTCLQTGRDAERVPAGFCSVGISRSLRIWTWYASCVLVSHPFYRMPPVLSLPQGLLSRFLSHVTHLFCVC